MSLLYRNRQGSFSRFIKEGTEAVFKARTVRLEAVTSKQFSGVPIPEEPECRKAEEGANSIQPLEDSSDPRTSVRNIG